MTYLELIGLINQWIITNGNREITAAVLNPVLRAMSDYTLQQDGDLENLNTTDKSNLVAAINEVNQALGNVNINSSQIYTGTDNPNVTPPPSFTAADFYIQLDEFNAVVAVFLYSGTTWINLTEIIQQSSTALQSVQAGTNITIDNTDPLNPVINSNNQQVTSKVVYCTLADVGATSPFQEDIDALVKDWVVAQEITKAENEDYLFGLKSDDETELYKTYRLANFGSGLIDETAELKLVAETVDKTKFIPITGTEADNPITGDLYFIDDQQKISVQDDVLSISSGVFDVSVFTRVNAYELLRIDNTEGYQARFSSNINNYFLTSNNPNFKGLVGNEEFDKQGDRKAFAQISDVEDAFNAENLGDAIYNNLSIKETPSDDDEFVAYDSITGEAVTVKYSSLNKPIVVSSNVTATLNRVHNVVANATLTDSSPVEGMGYTINVINGIATVGGVAYSVGSELYRHYHSGSWRTFEYVNGKELECFPYSNGDGVLGITHTGDTLETVLFPIPITAGYYQVKDWMNALFSINKPTITTNNVTYRMRIGTAGTTADNLLATFVTNQRSFAFSRYNMQFLTGNLIRTIFNAAGAQTDLNASSSISGVSVNPSNAFYLTLTAQLTDSTEQVQCIGARVSRIKPSN